VCSFAVRSSAFLGRTPASRGLIRDIAPLSAAYFADGRPTEFLVGTGRKVALRVEWSGHWTRKVRRSASPLRPGCRKQDRPIFRRAIAPLQPKPIHASQSAASVANPSTHTRTDHSSQAQIRPRTLLFRSRITLWRTTALIRSRSVATIFCLDRRSRSCEADAGGAM